MTTLSVPFAALDGRLRDLAEGNDAVPWTEDSADDVLEALTLVEGGTLTSAGHAYYLARHVLEDVAAAGDALGDVLKTNAVASAFCETLWGSGDVPVGGAVSLLKRLTGTADEQSAKRWLEILNKGGLVAYNRRNPRLRVRFNPDELASPDEDAARERDKGHVITPDSPYGNLLALRALLRASRGFLCWYEQHMGAKVLEVLYREIEKGTVSSIRLLSGPAAISEDTKSEFKRFAKEMNDRRGIACGWRVLSKKRAQERHDRLLFSDGLARNIPPLNLILRGSTGEILPSSVPQPSSMPGGMKARISGPSRRAARRRARQWRAHSRCRASTQKPRLSGASLKRAREDSNL